MSHNTPNQNPSKQQQQEDKQRVKQLILQLADEKVFDKFSSESINRENEKIKLLSGALVSIADLKKIIADTWQPYVPMFGMSTKFFETLFIKKGWPVEGAKKFVKPSIVAKHINDLIYRRLYYECPFMFQSINPYVDGRRRRYKHFQRLTPEGRTQAETFRDQAVALMLECKNFNEFEIRYNQMYKGRPLQLGVFEDNSIA
ncbi:MAG TPA: P63C domain-containing protein [Saprospiraceae bacterium]|nr:P63C domain-containing protein [Saprospiraceae bacterium]